MDSFPSSLRRDIRQIAEYHNDVTDALAIFFNGLHSSGLSRFADKSPQEMRELLQERVEETEQRSALAVLSRIEAALKTDFRYRCVNKLKDPISRKMRELPKYYAEDLKRLSIDTLLETWTAAIPEAKQIASELRGAWKYRNWLAHGRYWEPKLGRKYDYNYVDLLAILLVDKLPLNT